VTVAVGARRSGLLAAVADLLIEPIESEPPGSSRSAWPLDGRPVVAVIGLTPRCGTTTAARALGVELARRDPEGARSSPRRRCPARRYRSGRPRQCGSRGHCREWCRCRYAR
jgi:hypothetical protein